MTIEAIVKVSDRYHLDVATLKLHRTLSAMASKFHAVSKASDPSANLQSRIKVRRFSMGRLRLWADPTWKKLNDGTLMPIFGLGVYESDGEQCYNAVVAALKVRARAVR
jgi:hypothetical protein